MGSTLEYLRQKKNDIIFGIPLCKTVMGRLQLNIRETNDKNNLEVGQSSFAKITFLKFPMDSPTAFCAENWFNG